MPSFKPDYLLRTIGDVPLAVLWAQGVRCLLVDLDNTLARWNEPAAPAAAREWVRVAKDIGFEVMLISNNRTHRVKPYMEALNVRGIANAGKPWPSAFRRAASQLNAQPRACLMIGDQLVTDILGAKAVGMRAALVNPLDRTREHWTTRFNRALEKVLMWLMRIKRVQ